MNIEIKSKSGIAIYEQIEKQIKDQILSGKIEKGSPLPSIRSLAADLKISVITTKRAYEDLEKEGLIYSAAGKGFFVDDPDLDYLEEKRNVGLEQELEEWVKKASASGMQKTEAMELLSIYWEEEDANGRD